MPETSGIRAGGNTRRRNNSTDAAIGALVIKTNAAIAKLDKKHDGFIDEGDLKPMMKKLERVTNRMGQDNPDMDVGDLERPDARRALMQSRKGMKDADRITMIIAQAATNEIEEGREQVSVEKVQTAAKKHIESLVASLRSDAGGIMGGIEKMFAFILLPDAVLEAAIGRPLIDRVTRGGGDTFERPAPR